MKNLICLAVLLFLSVNIDAQRTTLKGKITDHKADGIKGVEIYVDMKRIKTSTNSRGKYSLKHSNKIQLITVYAPKYGFINWNYKGEKKIDFVFPKGSQAMGKDDFLALGYSEPVPIKEHEEKVYANYGSILEILEHDFQQVRVSGKQIIVGRRGINAVLIEDPLILVNDVPTNVTTLETIPTQEVKSIRVLSKVSETAFYGQRGMNGVIIVKLKTAKDETGDDG